ncbi:hypothetical protein NUV25_19085 [Burkholderia pseudomultivorans]|uniref:hypothetical protein n=1 Tax=Burkholderia pseudomultivorans TaxID=1207504 RepID=UPI0028743CC0|nr:hypothetical protein [Burkholderia pseudomultivorans]MDS0859816.1 hypothetical protein [Burkholderia pseudomultivorans]
MKRAALLVAIGATMACLSSAASADADIGVYIGAPAPIYQAPPPVVYAAPQVVGEPLPYYGYRHRDEDRRREWRHERRWHDEHDHHDQGDEQ